jgi:phosphoglycerate dehydrogenase-like enzyme
MTETIMVLDPISELTATRLRALLPPGLKLEHGASRDEAHQQAIIADADYAISGQIAVPGTVLRAARRLKLLHKWGVGTDNLDLTTAAELGIKVARTTGSNAVPVAEFTIGLIIAALRNLAFGHAELMNGDWRGGSLPVDSYTLSGKTVGIVGFGAIGKAVARMLSGFGCTILYNKSKPLDAEEERRLRVTYADLQLLLAASDIVTLHCPLTSATTGMINRAALRSMKRTAVLINVARGGVVVEDDLIAALQAREIHSAAMDVFEIEPLPAGHPLMTLDNVVITPHIAAGTVDNFEKTVRQMFRNIQHAKEGTPIPPQDVVVG